MLPLLLDGRLFSPSLHLLDVSTCHSKCLVTGYTSLIRVNFWAIFTELFIWNFGPMKRAGSWFPGPFRTVTWYINPWILPRGMLSCKDCNNFLKSFKYCYFCTFPVIPLGPELHTRFTHGGRALVSAWPWRCKVGLKKLTGEWRTQTGEQTPNDTLDFIIMSITLG